MSHQERIEIPWRDIEAIAVYVQETPGARYTEVWPESERVRDWVSANESKETERSDTEQPQDFPYGTLVARLQGPLHTGEVIEPTNADRERGAYIHGVGLHQGTMVFVQWRSLRSWEYAKDLRRVP
jgi:hypothetical protein